MDHNVFYITIKVRYENNQLTKRFLKIKKFYFYEQVEIG